MVDIMEPNPELLSNPKLLSRRSKMKRKRRSESLTELKSVLLPDNRSKSLSTNLNNKLKGSKNSLVKNSKHRLKTKTLLEENVSIKEERVDDEDELSDVSPDETEVLSDIADHAYNVEDQPEDSEHLRNIDSSISSEMEIVRDKNAKLMKKRKIKKKKKKMKITSGIPIKTESSDELNNTTSDTENDAMETSVDSELVSSADSGLSSSKKEIKEEISPTKEDVKPAFKRLLRLTQQQKEELAHIKPSVIDREKERNFRRIATKGMVQLFNAVQRHQSSLQADLRSARGSVRREEKVLSNASSGAFLNTLREAEEISDHDKSSPPSAKRRKKKHSSKAKKSHEDSNERTYSSASDNKRSWKVLSDDFLTSDTVLDDIEETDSGVGKGSRPSLSKSKWTKRWKKADRSSSSHVLE